VVVLAGSLWIRHRRTRTTTARDDPTAPAAAVEAGR
jgi:hypothetical protein